MELVRIFLINAYDIINNSHFRVKSLSGLTLHDFELTTTCDGPPRRRRRQDVV